MIDSSGIIFFIFFAYAFVYMQMKCGAFDAAVGAMLRKLHEHKLFIIPLFMLIFGLCGSTFGMTEETFGFIPVFMGIAVALRYDALVGGAMVYVGVITGFAAATVNPFTIGVAHTIAELPMFSGLWFRCSVFAVFMCVSDVYKRQLMPVVVGIVLPLAAVAVSMLTAAGCRDSFGCHRITACLLYTSRCV